MRKKNVQKNCVPYAKMRNKRLIFSAALTILVIDGHAAHVKKETKSKFMKERHLVRPD